MIPAQLKKGFRRVSGVNRESEGGFLRTAGWRQGGHLAVVAIESLDVPTSPIVIEFGLVKVGGGGEPGVSDLDDGGCMRSRPWVDRWACRFTRCRWCCPCGRSRSPGMGPVCLLDCFTTYRCHVSGSRFRSGNRSWIGAARGEIADQMQAELQNSDGSIGRRPGKISCMNPGTSQNPDQKHIIT